MNRASRWVGGAIAGALMASLMAPGVAGAVTDRPDDRGRAPCSAQQRGRSLQVYLLNADGTLSCTDTRRPHRATPIGRITGLTTDTALVGIDVRPATGALVGLGDQGGIYVIDPATGAASNRVQLSVPLSGAAFGVDFNPTVDRLRVVSDTGQNLRINVDTGVATVDTALSAPGVAGAAYTNNDADPTTATTLYDIDTAADQVSIQAPPNNGTLNPVGSLGVDTSAVVGFDIFSDLDRAGTTEDVTALASLTVGGQSGLYEINLFTGRASSRGNLPAGVVDIAIPLDR
jgi:hypothetical protein